MSKLARIRELAAKASKRPWEKRAAKQRRHGWYAVHPGIDRPAFVTADEANAAYIVAAANEADTMAGLLEAAQATINQVEWVYDQELKSRWCPDCENQEGDTPPHTPECGLGATKAAIETWDEASDE